ncbi:tyrosine-type recombinase/integrase [Fictibacillus sp. WQ 8-8]|uniref:tyrosine-type recombinase/integrase n=1 Tax=Fictibacillus sp. WQ 8-8 TaxID=2938788 RepID=UPI002109F926|nr:tyrosine-type recombinase/integrase [Fictibacillus sp. WQ 8-8]MCQ6268586.1 tyrosine-type recombinase/integrase [Fictibacillus sp. WQ 8-8]
MDLVTSITNVTNEKYLTELKETLLEKNLLDENRNLNLGESKEEDFLEWFFALKIFKEGRRFSPHTIKAYRSDAKTLLKFMLENKLSFRDIGFPEVKAYNNYIKTNYANKTAIRKLDFFRRLLEFGYETQFYKVLLSTWVVKPPAKKGHNIIEETRQDQPQTRFQLRELSQEDAELLISYFPIVVKTDTYRKQLQTRNLLIGYLLYTTGLRASELLNLNWGSFRKNRRDNLLVDVIGKGNKPRTIPIKKETRELLFSYRELLQESTELNMQDTNPLFYSLYNKEESRFVKKRLTYPALYKIVKSAVKLAAQNTAISPHWFRHTFVTVMLENDVPLAVVKDWAGHSDISTTNLYLERINQDNMDVHLEKVILFNV